MSFCTNLIVIEWGLNHPRMGTPKVPKRMMSKGRKLVLHDLPQPIFPANANRKVLSSSQNLHNEIAQRYTLTYQQKQNRGGTKTHTHTHIHNSSIDANEKQTTTTESAEK